MSNKQKLRPLFFAMIAILLIAIIAVSSYRFNRKLIQIGMDTALKELERDSLSNSDIVQNEYDNMTNALIVLRSIIAEDNTIDQTNIVHHLKLICTNTKFNTVGISNANGEAIDSNGFLVNLENREYFQQAKNGNVVISNVLPSKVIANQDVQVIAVPIIDNQVFSGIVYGILDINIVSDSLDNSTDSNVYTTVIDEFGKPITPLQTESWLLGYETIWSFYDQCEFMESSPNEIKRTMENNGSGYYVLKLGNDTRVSYYVPLGIGSYYLVSNMNMEPLHHLFNQIRQNAINNNLVISGALIILFTAIFIFNQNIAKELKKSYQARLSSEEVLRIAANHSNSFVFVYDITSKTLTRKTEKIHPLINADIIENVPKSLIEKGIIDSNSIDNFVNLFNQLNFETSVQSEIKTNINNTIRWYRISLHNVYDQSRAIINTVGNIEDISEMKDQLKRIAEEKQQKEEFKDKAEKDGLTGLFNGPTAMEKINNLLAQKPLPNRQHLFVLMDLDNFKLINDTFGHQYGDKVIKNIAHILENKFRQDDIIARMGGDEFCVFLYNTKGFDPVKHLFEELINQCNITYQEDNQSVTISASFGIAISPSHGNTFSELSKKADIALYEVKRNAKKGYKVYDASK